MPVTGDTAVEADERFSVVLGAITLNNSALDPAAVTVSTGTGTGTIENDDSLVAVEFAAASNGDVEAVGGDIPQLLVNGTVSSDQVIEVQVTGGTASAGTDYSHTVALTIPAGVYDGTAATALLINLTVTDDALVEGDESITFSLALPATGGEALSVGDADGDTSTQSVNTYTLQDDDSGPVAYDDVVATPMDTDVVIPVLVNDIDADADPVSVVPAIFTTANGGQVVIDNGGTPDDPSDDTVTYTPAAGFSGNDSFEYSVTDPHGNSASATVSVTVFDDTDTVNDPPTANPDSDTTAQDTPVLIDVLFNDSDPEGDVLSLSAVDAVSAAGGTVTINDNGTPNDPSDDFVEYTPAPGYTGIDTFSYTINDGNGNSVTVIVTVRVIDPVLDPVPTAVGDNASAPANTAVAIDVLSNDQHPAAGEALTISGVSQPANGTVTIDDNGTSDPSDDVVMYEPGLDFTGTDSFTYTITDSNGDTAITAVTVTVTEKVIELDVQPMCINDTPYVDYSITAV
ncbi:MAG: tandem-95 repeat protein, partial [Candidatus Competibacteraceae bacterium]|nr:tandem-95 repeat protein [Candidatus Competibacteraceae bacterium]